MFPSKKKKNFGTSNGIISFISSGKIERALQINLASITTINQLVTIHNQDAKFLGGKSPIKVEKKWNLIQ